jgi:DNA-binding transcriptional regulator YiaG
MTPAELQQYRTKLGLSQAELSALLGAHAITVSKWERGIVPVPKYLHYVLWAIEHNAPRD